MTMPPTHDQKPPSLEALEIGGTYRLRRGTFLGRDHTPDYDKGEHIYMRIVEGPSAENSGYKFTTFNEDGLHLGPGGGWDKAFETKLTIRPKDLEVIPADTLPFDPSRAMLNELFFRR